MGNASASSGKSAELLARYKELERSRRETQNQAERTALLMQMMDLEPQVRAALKNEPVPEPLGMTALNSIADRMVEIGEEIFASRIRFQHSRHPAHVPFESFDHLRQYLSPQIGAEKIALIPQLSPKSGSFLGKLFKKKS